VGVGGVTVVRGAGILVAGGVCGSRSGDVPFLYFSSTSSVGIGLGRGGGVSTAAAFAARLAERLFLLLLLLKILRPLLLPDDFADARSGLVFGDFFS
jgi:hypothetical protein